MFRFTRPVYNSIKSITNTHIPPKPRWNPITDINLENGMAYGSIIGCGICGAAGFLYSSYEYIHDDPKKGNNTELYHIPGYTLGGLCIGFISGAAIGCMYPLSVPVLVSLGPIYGIKQNMISKKEESKKEESKKEESKKNDKK